MKQDQISLATKRKLAAALKSAMKKKAFDRITVKELLEECDISRPTFYYHFEDIYSLMKWMFETEAVELLKKSDNCLTWDEGIFLLLSYIKENREVCLCAYNSVGRDLLRRFFSQSVRSVLRTFMDTLLEDMTASPKEEQVEFIADFYTSAFAASILNWLQDGAKREPEEMLHLWDISAHGSIAAALERSAQEAK